MEKFERAVRKNKIVIAYFSYPSCSVCKVLRPKVEALVAKYKQVGFEYVDTHLNPEIAGQFMVFSVPTLIFFVEGRESKRLGRNFSIMEVQDFIERLTALMGA